MCIRDRPGVVRALGRGTSAVGPAFGAARRFARAPDRPALFRAGGYLRGRRGSFSPAADFFQSGGSRASLRLSLIHILFFCFAGERLVERAASRRFWAPAHRAAPFFKAQGLVKPLAPGRAQKAHPQALLRQIICKARHQPAPRAFMAKLLLGLHRGQAGDVYKRQTLASLAFCAISS